MSIRSSLKALPRATWVLFLGTFINRFGTFVMPFLMLYLTRRGFTASQAGIAIGVYGAGHLSAAMLGGHLADRIGRRHTIALSMFSAAAAMLALSQAQTYSSILVLTYLAGTASELYRPAAGALIGDLVAPEQRVFAFGMYRLAVNLGFAAGPATAGFLADHSFTWLFVGDAVTSAAYGVIALIALPHGVRSSRHDESAHGAFRHALQNRRFLYFLMATASVMWIEFQIHSTLPLYLTSLGYSASQYGLLLSINGVMIVLFELAITQWTQRFDPQRMIALGYALSAIGFAITGLMTSIPGLVVTVVIWTIGEMMYAPVTGAYVTNLAPERFRGRYHGMWVMMWSLGMLVGPALGAYLFERDPTLLWIACAVVGTLGASLALIRPRAEMDEMSSGA